MEVTIARLAALADATAEYAESLTDPDLTNVYAGKALGLWQAAAMLRAEYLVTVPASS